MNGTNTEQKLKAAEAKHAAATTAHKDAQAQLEQALAALKADGTDKARKVVLAAEDATRLTSTELGWATEALEHARAEHQQAERAERVAAYEQACRACSADVFRRQIEPICKQLAELARKSAELAAQGATVSAQFQAARTALRSDALALGCMPAPEPAFAKILAAETLLATGASPETALRDVFGVDPAPGADPAAQLALAYQGENPAEVATLLRQLQDAERRRALGVRKLLEEGSGIGSNSSPTSFGSFMSSCEECDRARQRLAELGFGAVADTVYGDTVADELQAVDTRRAALLIDEYRAAEYARAHEARQGRHANAQAHAAECHAVKGQLLNLGCPKLVSALPTHRTPQSPGLAFVAF